MKAFFHNLILLILIRGLQWGKPPTLKRWLELETYKDKIIKATEGEHFPEYLLHYLSVAFGGISSKWFDHANWIRIVSAFYLSVSKSPKIELPITTPTDEKSKEDDWSYDGRTWHLYSHMLAKNYGWDLEYISCLPVIEALSKIQEIMVDEQLEHEFIYGLSENAYSYDKRTNKSTFVPLPRPHWMRKKIQPIKKTLIPASMMPMGMGIEDNVLPDEYLPKQIQ